MPTTRLPAALYRADQVRELDRLAIEVHGIPGATLMERAGAAAFRVLRARWPESRRLGVLCGSGNNGGDGYVVARLAREAGLEVTAWQLGNGPRAGGDAVTALARLRAAGVEPAGFEAGAPVDCDLLVDGLLGTGLNGPVEGVWAAAIDALNDSGRPVLALDIPSGLHADTGAVLGCAVAARVTVTFIGLKQGLVTGAGPGYCGRLVYDDLDVPAAVPAALGASARLLDAGDHAAWLAPRSRTAHKGDFGHLLVVGGVPGMAGAARMAAEAALRAGAGLVSLATHPEHAALVSQARPEIMAHGVDDAAALAPLLERATVVVAGPGLGRSAWSWALLEAVLDSPRPLLLDADALGLLAEAPRERSDWVLTPHPGEAARLLGREAAAVQADRFAAAAALQARYGGVLVLKGAGTLVQGPAETPGVCPAGNPGMASGGMGDVLSGIIGALLAQGIPAQAAAELGICLHARAADAAATSGGERGLLATDLLPHLRRRVNP